MTDLQGRLQDALDAASIQARRLRPMEDKGLAHEHVWLERGDGKHWVARLPKQSQMALSPEANLTYQACCFRRASQGGHTPELQGILPPGQSLPRGGLLVTAIDGRVARLPEDLAEIATTLASVHRLPLPDPETRKPLLDPASPAQAMLEEIRRQAAYLDNASLDSDARRQIEVELQALEKWLKASTPAGKALISFDAHPGNFIIRADGRAMLVDLEKCRYGLPGFDLAHATLYTSTTWDIDTHAVLGVEDMRAFYARWALAMSDSSNGAGAGAGAGEHSVDERTILQCRRAMWLWSITWCAKWRVEHLRSRDGDLGGQDWSTDLSEVHLIEHVANRVDHYLSPAIITKVRDELQALQQGGLFQ